MEHLPFWQALVALVQSSEIVIDRPRGSLHPRYPDFCYPLDYGYLQGTTSGDGQGIDVWLGSDPSQRLSGVIMTVDTVKRDAELKILLGCTHEEQQQILQMVNNGSLAGILLECPESL